MTKSELIDLMRPGGDRTKPPDQMFKSLLQMVNGHKFGEVDLGFLAGQVKQMWLDKSISKIKAAKE